MNPTNAITQFIIGLAGPLFIFLAIILAVLVLLVIIVSIIKKNPNWILQENQKQKENTDYSQSYQAKYLLTRNEWHEYKKLKQFAEAKDLQVCPKVRLLDIIEPRRGEANYRSLLMKVQSKHVDFLITDQDLRIKAVVELDDGSHDSKDRKERDEFVDTILTSVGYKVIHTKGITEETLKDIA